MEEVRGKLQFKDMLYSEYGMSDKSTTYCSQEDEKGLLGYGDMKRLVSYACKVITKFCPWNKCEVTKKEVAMGDGNAVVIKWVKIKFAEIEATKNEALINCYKNVQKMLLWKQNGIPELMYALWSDAMTEKRFCIDRYTSPDKDGNISAITFRFIATKWNGSWEEPKDEVPEVKVTKPEPKPVAEEQHKTPKNKPAKKKEVKKAEAKPSPKKLPNAGDLEDVAVPAKNRYMYDEADDQSRIADFN